MSHKKEAASKRPSKPIPPRLYPLLVEVEKLLDRKKWAPARQQLLELNRQFPRRPEILEMLAVACGSLDDSQGYEQAASQLLTLVPEDPDLVYNLGVAYMKNLRPALAIRQFRLLLQKWPDDELAAEGQNLLASLEPATQESWASMGFPEDKAEEIAVLHEQVNSQIESGHYQEARRLAEELTRKAPNFISGWNNLSQLQWLNGQRPAAISSVRHALEIDPQNVHALANLVRFQFFNADLEGARETARQLHEAPAEVGELLMKKAEAFSYLGDDEAVLEIYAAAERARQLPHRGQDPLLYHLAAVAHARQGNEKAARRLWQLALDIDPGYEFAQRNLEDFKRKPGERNAPWPFPFPNWIEEKIVKDIQSTMRSHPRADDVAMQRILQKWLAAHRNVGFLVPHLLDRGDEAGREFALMIVSVSRAPELMEAARDFALSQRGPDSSRHQAAQVASEAGLLQNPVRLWWRGAWIETILFAFEVHDEPTSRANKKVLELARRGHDTLKDGYAEDAEKLYREALALEPDAPDLKNNLTAALMAQGREEEGIALLEEIHAQSPDYLFGRVGLARVALRDGNLEKAKALMEPLMNRRRFHVSEFRAWVQTQIEMSLFQKQKDGARTWLEIWEAELPEDPMIPAYRRRIR